MKTIFAIFFLLGLSFSSPCLAKPRARTKIYVGAYGFAPYYDIDKGRGLINDVLEILNQIQADYDFRVVEIPSKRRYQSFAERRIDMIFFEDPRWGWSSIKHQQYPTGLDDAEVYITRKTPQRNQTFFEDLQNKSIAGILGYHYGFANLNADENYLRSKFDIHLVSHNFASVRLVLKDRVQIAVVPRSYIQSYLKEHKADRKQILISDKIDQKYDLKILVHPQVNIPKETLESLFTQLTANPQYQKLFSPE
ncbi:type 2 periplasmic-binding domain-containing protein [Bdellovibrio svalbardensis]|uniref:Solute-binding protein family 3/N-terminal domain-containing protein n=1 Tax=Bdellovibrio svalbardensis TaxID=2972972 RepID=A0ABT6DM99_9BACT|nr:hypothetical protein [Bdellovibrio svalbardensis]MDG0818017.1 hypothetical protein [Bdellovibrio svalbardensis]